MAVIEKKDIDFKECAESNDKIMIKFFADWCGSCRLLAPKFERLSEEPDNKSILFVKVNAEHNPQLRQMVGVDNLPYFAAIDKMKILDKDSTSKEDRIKEIVEKLR